MVNRADPLRNATGHHIDVTTSRERILSSVQLPYKQDRPISRLYSATSRYWFCVLLALPAAGMIATLTESPSPHVIHELLQPIGEFAAHFMIIVLMATPLAIVFKGCRRPRWLIKNRRHFGAAAFGYALVHTVFYLMDANHSQDPNAWHCDWTSGRAGLPSSSLSLWPLPRWTTAFVSWGHDGRRCGARSIEPRS